MISAKSWLLRCLLLADLEGVTQERWAKDPVARDLLDRIVHRPWRTAFSHLGVLVLIAIAAAGLAAVTEGDSHPNWFILVPSALLGYLVVLSFLVSRMSRRARQLRSRKLRPEQEL